MDNLAYLKWLFEPTPLDPKIEAWLTDRCAERFPPATIRFSTPTARGDSWVYKAYVKPAER